MNAFNYERISASLAYLAVHHTEQPSLEELAQHAGLSAFHFQRMFVEWAGVSPKRFLQYMNVSYLRDALRNSGASLPEAAEGAGLSGTGRLHDLIVSVEAMTPAQFKSGGKGLRILHTRIETMFGPLVAASTERGICHTSFLDDGRRMEEIIRDEFPFALHEKGRNHHLGQLEKTLTDVLAPGGKIALHVKGTNFQIRIWEALLKIPPGHVTTYGAVAKLADAPNAARAAGSAIGDNPVALLIPCHRVIRSTGITGGYMWGAGRKKLILACEAAALNEQQHALPAR